MRLVSAHLCMKMSRGNPWFCMAVCVLRGVCLCWCGFICACVEGRCWYQLTFLSHSPSWYILFSFSLNLKPINLEDLLDNELQRSVTITHAHNECYLSPPLCPDLYISSVHTNSHSHACTVSILPNESLLQPWYGQIFDVKAELSHHLAFLLLCALPKELKSVCKNMRTPLLVSALFMVAKKWRQLNCVSVDGFIKNFGICIPQDTI